MNPTLSIVMPVYNEADWAPIAIGDAVEAQRRSDFSDVELVIVDDGSDQPTKDALAALDTGLPTRIIEQENAGRYAARAAGIAAARGDMVLLIDSRVSIHPDALRFVVNRLEPGGELPIWNAHVDVEVDGNSYARFWNVLTEIALSDYFDDPQTTSYGLEEFDRFPKGTTCFLAPRELLLWALERFDTFYKDARNANDDTLLIRSMASKQRINISPGFSCRYRGRGNLRAFARHAHHRGIVFVDGYLRPGSRFLPMLVAFPFACVGALAAALRFPRSFASAALLAPIAAFMAVLARRRNPRDAAVVGLLGPVWFATYAAGVWKGLALAVAGRFRR